MGGEDAVTVPRHLYGAGIISHLDAQRRGRHRVYSGQTSAVDSVEEG